MVTAADKRLEMGIKPKEAKMWKPTTGSRHFETWIHAYIFNSMKNKELSEEFSVQIPGKSLTK